MREARLQLTMSTTKRPYIEVDTGGGGVAKDPIGLFSHMLRLKHGGTEEVEESNKKLLEGLIQRGQIPKSSIVWHDERVSRIYGFSVDDRGKIEYSSPSRGSPKRVAKTYVADVPDVDMSVLRNAIIRSKQMAI